MSSTVQDLGSSPTFLKPLADYLEVSKRKFNSCISPLDLKLEVEGLRGEVNFHFVKFDPTTFEPKFDLLVKALIKHIVRFTLSLRTREHIKSGPDYEEDEGELFILARKHFRKFENSGEVGELLLFFLLEAAIGAPQVVSKMEIKTNKKEEVKGSDGIHVKWDNNDNHLDVFLGEAKLHKSIGPAIKSALGSISKFYNSNRLDEELHLVTAHFKHLDEEFKTYVTQWVNREESEKECHIINCCLIGFDWKQYSQLSDQKEKLFNEFENKYRVYTERVQKILKNRFQNYSHRHLTFHFLFLPFQNVEEFREAFYKELRGEGHG